MSTVYDEARERRFAECLAVAIEAACNAEGRDLNARTFARFTAGLTIDQKDQVHGALPRWAQRRIAETIDGEHPEFGGPIRDFRVLEGGGS